MLCIDAMRLWDLNCLLLCWLEFLHEWFQTVAIYFQESSIHYNWFLEKTKLVNNCRPFRSSAQFPPILHALLSVNGFCFHHIPRACLFNADINQARVLQFLPSSFVRFLLTHNLCLKNQNQLYFFCSLIPICARVFHIFSVWLRFFIINKTRNIIRRFSYRWAEQVKRCFRVCRVIFVLPKENLFKRCFWDRWVTW